MTASPPPTKPDIKRQLDPFSELESERTNAESFFEKTVYPFWCNLKSKPQLAVELPAILLTGIFLSLRQAVDRLSNGAFDLNIFPFALQANEATRVLEKRSDRRTRRVVVWIDSAVGGPPPTIRVGLRKGSVASGGVFVTPGIQNEIGRVPPDKELWMSSDVPMRVYILEEV